MYYGIILNIYYTSGPNTETSIHIYIYIMLMQYVFIGHLWSRRKIIILSIATCV